MLCYSKIRITFKENNLYRLVFTNLQNTQYCIHKRIHSLTLQITGSKKQSDEGAARFDVWVNLPCYAFDAVSCASHPCIPK